MKWTYSIQNKLVASSVLGLLCLLVLFSNYIDRNHTKNVKNAISTLYEDRLIAEEYILNMTSGIYQAKEVLNANIDDTIKLNNINNLLIIIKERNAAYQKTKLTTLEKGKANEFATTLNKFESIPLQNVQIKLVSANKVLGLLNELSTIQLKESRQIMDYAETLYNSSKTSSQFVFVLIIIILLVLQALVFASKPLIIRNNKKSQNLN